MTRALILAALALAACRPNLGPVVGCTPGAASCVDGAPAICSASQRWQRAGDVRCAEVFGRCVVTDAGTAHCAPLPSAADAGVAEQ